MVVSDLFSLFWMINGYRLSIVLKFVICIGCLLGWRGKRLDFGFFMRKKGKVKILGGCFFIGGNFVRIFKFMKIDN